MNTRSESRFSPLVLFCLALALQVAIVGGVALARSSSLKDGTTVYLKIQPVDPRDPFRGDYLTYTYEASEVPREYLAMEEPAIESTAGGPVYVEPPRADVKPGETIWVPLQRAGQYWVPTYGVTKTRPVDELGYGGAAVARATVKSSDIATLTVTYGAEQFFVPEGAGLQFPTGDAVARVTVGTDGKVTVRAILVNGRPWP
jgi:uncharacterized membrane-anchored protein